MRIRSIKPEFWRSDDITSLDWHTRLVFIGLWSYVDDNGVGDDKPKAITADLFALEDDFTECSLRVHGALQTLSDRGLITRYVVDGRPYLHVTNWRKHQVINRPSAPRKPLPTSENSALSEASATAHGALTEASLPGAGEQGAEEQGAEEQTPLRTAAPSALATAEPDPFDAFWSTYPRKVGKAKAKAAFAKALKRTAPELIIAGAKRYAADPNRVEQFTKYPEGWLNRDGWEDAPEVARNGGSNMEGHMELVRRLGQAAS